MQHAKVLIQRPTRSKVNHDVFKLRARRVQVRLPRVERAVVPNHVKERNIFLECGFVSLFDVLVDIEQDCLSTRKHNHVSSLCKNSKALAGNVLPEHTLSVSQNELEESETHNFQF